MFKLRDMKVGASQNPGLSIYTVIWNSEKVGEFPDWQKKCKNY